MVPELPELPVGMPLPAVDPKAQGGWQGPDDVVVSTTLLWPRPNRSWCWIVPWALMVVTCYISVLVPTAMRNGPIEESERAIERHILSTGLLDVSSPASFWAWLHDKWLPHLHQHRFNFPPSGALLYDMRQRPIIAACGNSYIARPRPIDDLLNENSNSAFWGVGMVLRQHRVRMTNCSSVLANVDLYTPAKLREAAGANEPRAGRCYERIQLQATDAWDLTQFTTTVRSRFAARDCAQGCSEFGPEACKAFIVTQGDGYLTARYTDAGLSGAKVPTEEPVHPLLATSKQLQMPSASRQATCFLAAGGKQAFPCGGNTVQSAQDAPPLGDACVNSVQLTAFREGKCPLGGQVCAPLYSAGNLDVKAKRWGGREGFGLRSGNGGWNRRVERSSDEWSEAERRLLYDWSSAATSNSTHGANSSKPATLVAG
eukprot:CAMPEP_0179417804 /NCGR_PEP_ID=MMETSP0799-20121207/7574_1 /TAXON_ID=46947 /ORGANISM="Geminigera cryophila, Strain CCMP2564" /LENGTH=428 /DNA_ID=CAMNT_0021190861 /DNA_START=113 /DNA_END=1395 /DNA_ORIENTATION=+